MLFTVQVHDGLPLVAGTPGQEVPTKEIHVFGKQWALQPSDYKAVTFERPFWSLGKSMVTSFFSKWFGGGST